MLTRCLNQCMSFRLEYWTFWYILKVRLGPDFGPKSPDFNFHTKTGLFRTGLSPDSIPSKNIANANHFVLSSVL